MLVGRREKLFRDKFRFTNDTKHSIPYGTSSSLQSLKFSLVREYKPASDGIPKMPLTGALYNHRKIFLKILSPSSLLLRPVPLMPRSAISTSPRFRFLFPSFQHPVKFKFLRDVILSNAFEMLIRFLQLVKLNTSR